MKWLKFLLKGLLLCWGKELQRRQIVFFGAWSNICNILEPLVWKTPALPDKTLSRKSRTEKANFIRRMLRMRQGQGFVYSQKKHNIGQGVHGGPFRQRNFLCFHKWPPKVGKKRIPTSWCTKPYHRHLHYRISHQVSKDWEVKSLVQ